MPRGPKTAPGRGRTLSPTPPPSPPPLVPPPWGGGRTNFLDLDPVWERERERVNRDALTRLKTPGGVGGFKAGRGSREGAFAHSWADKVHIR